MKEQKEILPHNPEIVVLGANGFLGTFITKELQNSGEDVRGLSRNEFDISNEESFKTIDEKQSFEGKIILNFAAYTDVDKAAQEKNNKNGMVWQTNVTAMANLARIAYEQNAFLISIGSDFEFAGLPENPGPYREDSKETNTNALSWYGYSKAIGLEEIQKSGSKFAYIRVTYPFGDRNNKNDFINRTKRYVENGYPLFTDQVITPTYLPDLADVIRVITSQRLEGIFHVASSTTTTPYDLATYLYTKNTEIKKGSLEEYLESHEALAKRPILGGLSVTNTENKLGIKFCRINEVSAELLAK